ncbi:MAG: NAD-dependent epimerase/dehydratase family protein [Treponema sp.]|nr:NAD-dependent epimerase/dehydratase family protein [Treponema sp.]
MKILITGAAGFIGYHLAKRLAAENCDIVCIDNINDYYDVELKHGRLKNLSAFPCIRFIKMDICDAEKLDDLFSSEKFDIAVHLAAQAGVRFSLTNPNIYISSNVQGFLNILEAAKKNPIRHLVYASSSSVYGLNTEIPFSEKHTVARPASLYAASKLINEHMAHTYSHLFGIPTTGLRFFTVYGPWGRPDMALFIFAKSIIEGKTVTIFNNGNMQRDFTYIDDIIEGIVRVKDLIPKAKDENSVPASIYNIGNGSPIKLMDFVKIIEEKIGKKAIIEYAPMQPGDIPSTWADCSALERDTGFKPSTPIREGIGKFVDWYKNFY